MFPEESFSLDFLLGEFGKSLFLPDSIQTEWRAALGGTNLKEFCLKIKQYICRKITVIFCNLFLYFKNQILMGYHKLPIN